MDLIGQTLGNYYIIEELGRGGMAVVYLAENQNNVGARQVAIKVLLPEVVQRLDILRRFQRESDLYEKLKHPRIVHAYGLQQIEGHTFLVMEYMKGDDLTQRIRQKERLSWDESVRIIEQVAEALSFAHGQGVVHRDVKPSNILFDANGNAYLSDFGVAHDAESATITAVGMQPGTYHYMAPEQIQGEKVDPRTDQFALATVFYQMICGYLPFAATDTFALAHLIVNEPPALLSPDLEAPYGVAAVLDRAHAKAPDGRYPNIMAFAHALKQLSFEDSGPVTQRDILTSNGSQSSRRSIGAMASRWGKWAIALVVLLALLFVAIRFLPTIFAALETRPPQPALTPVQMVVQTQVAQSPDQSPPTSLPGGISVQTGVSPTALPSSDAPDDQEAKTLGKIPTLVSTVVPTKVKKTEKTETNSSGSKSTPPTQPTPQSHSEGRVTLQNPQPGQSLRGRVTFSWQTDFRLGENESYELAFWRPGQEPMGSAMSPVGAGREASKTFNIDGVPFLTPGPWQWGVFLVEASPFKRIRLISATRDFIYSPDTDGTFPSPPPK
jgi:serine/threonine protein kinase